MSNDPALKACADAMAAENALRALIDKRDPVADDLVEADEALEAAYATIPTTAAGITALAMLALEVEEPEPHIRQVLASIRDASANLLQVAGVEGERSTARGSLRHLAQARFLPHVKSNTSMIA